ncbi:MAG TPA: terminase small subunit [Dongiaceae bacterium]|nr:terminase small subunit [Dongiaceae bacterium]
MSKKPPQPPAVPFKPGPSKPGQSKSGRSTSATPTPPKPAPHRLPADPVPAAPSAGAQAGRADDRPGDDKSAGDSPADDRPAGDPQPQARRSDTGKTARPRRQAAAAATPAEAHAAWKAASPRSRSLRLREQHFVECYLATGNATEAARQVGYLEYSAGNAGYRLLQRPAVAAAIAGRQEDLRRRNAVTVDRVISELAKLAFADPRDLFTADGKLKPLHELDDASAASIAALEVLAVAGGPRAAAGRAARAASAQARDGSHADEAAGGESGDTVLELRKIKRWDKAKALELLGRYLGLFKDRLELGVSSDLAASIEAARKRSRALDAEAPQVIDGGKAIEVETGEVATKPAGEDEG